MPAAVEKSGPWGIALHVFSIALVLSTSALGAPGVASSPAHEGGADPFHWTGADGEQLLFSSVDEVKEFLRTAEVLSMKELGKGTTVPRKVLLEKDGKRMHAVFRTVDYHKSQWHSEQGLKLDFRDHYVYECAAYELGRLLGLDNIPPAVLRTIRKEKGSLQAWVEDAMNEDERIKKKIKPASHRDWAFQIQMMLMFDNLIYNDDRNQGNILIDPSWRMWLIDHTRAFQRNPYLKDVSGLYLCDQGVWGKLKSLDQVTLQEKLEAPGFLTSREIELLLERRNLLVEHFEKLIEQKSAAAVLLNF